MARMQATCRPPWTAARLAAVKRVLVLGPGLWAAMWAAVGVPALGLVLVFARFLAGCYQLYYCLTEFPHERD